MKAAVIVFPGSNCDRDAQVALRRAMGAAPLMVWHKEADFDPVDLIVLPGGFSHGDYLRCGAMAANAPVMRSRRGSRGAGNASGASGSIRIWSRITPRLGDSRTVG